MGNDALVGGYRYQCTVSDTSTDLSNHCGEQPFDARLLRREIRNQETAHSDVLEYFVRRDVYLDQN